VELPLGNAGKRWAALLVSLAVATPLTYTAGKIFLADRWNRSSKPTSWLRAAAIEPKYGEYWHHLGFYRQWDFEGADLHLAQEYYLKAVQINPRSSRYWMDLASAYEQADETARAGEAFERARAAYPISAEVKWNYGNFLLRQGAISEGYSQIRKAIDTNPKLIPLAISRCWNSNPDVDRLLDEALPPDVDAYFSALDFFASGHDVDSGLKVWNRLLRLGKTLPLKRTFPFLDVMIQGERTGDAERVWKQAVVAAGEPLDKPADDSVVWNGGFERDPLGGGFDWRENGITGAAMEIDTAVFHSGARSMRIDFEGGSNLDFQNLFQYVPVDPSRPYHFRAFLRTEGITTESGMRFFLTDPSSRGATAVLTEGLVGTQPWTALEADLTTGPASQIVLIQLRRLPSRLFDNKLGGTVWIDDVSLVPLGQSSAKTP
jgi:tetratricopeptide (TPR) repeat protein